MTGVVRSFLEIVRFRPVPVYFIAALCVTQMLAVLQAEYMFLNSQFPDDSARDIAIRDAVILGIYPSILCIAGILLLLMRKEAIYAFGAYFIYGMEKIVFESGHHVAALSLAVVFGCIVYALRLRRAGRLK